MGSFPLRRQFSIFFAPLPLSPLSAEAEEETQEEAEPGSRRLRLKPSRAHLLSVSLPPLRLLGGTQEEEEAAAATTAAAEAAAAEAAEEVALGRLRLATAWTGISSRAAGAPGACARRRACAHVAFGMDVNLGSPAQLSSRTASVRALPQRRAGATPCPSACLSAPSATGAAVESASSCQSTPPSPFFLPSPEPAPLPCTLPFPLPLFLSRFPSNPAFVGKAWPWLPALGKAGPLLPASSSLAMPGSRAAPWAISASCSLPHTAEGLVTSCLASRVTAPRTLPVSSLSPPACPDVGSAIHPQSVSAMLVTSTACK